jgi:hypothetical protein
MTCGSIAAQVARLGENGKENGKDRQGLACRIGKSLPTCLP